MCLYNKMILSIIWNAVLAFIARLRVIVVMLLYKNRYLLQVLVIAWLCHVFPQSVDFLAKNFNHVCGIGH